MARGSTRSGALTPLTNCYIIVPVSGINQIFRGTETKIILKALPELSDSKSVAYNDEPVIGRQFPLKTFSHGENRTITMVLHFYVLEHKDIKQNLFDIAALKSAAYTSDAAARLVGSVYVPPPICRIRCGNLLSKNELCVILKSYSISADPDVPWDEETYLPYKVDVNTEWQVVYSSESLPGQENILSDS